ncbi:MAG: iron-containing redox enzyme family protein [Alphaproteobacteria bacterium]
MEAAQQQPEALSQPLLRQLMMIWVDFDSRLNNVPLIEKINRGKLRLEDYQLFLRNHRQQVVEGSRWIARAASSITAEYEPLRSRFLKHAVTEHRDFRMLEDNYVATGGSREDITNGQKNIGSEALSAWMFHRASQPNPFDLLGAMFIIEGLGQKKAKAWGEAIRQQLKLPDEAVSFLIYHGKNDESHMEEFEEVLESGILTAELVATIVKTAKVTARLYLLQLEEIGYY